MTAMSDVPDRRVRVAGCFSPEDIRFLDRVLDEALSEAAASPARHLLGSDEIRASLAASIMASAGIGDLEPARLKAAALDALDALTRPQAAPPRLGRASG
jgi:hypothetical protein